MLRKNLICLSSKFQLYTKSNYSLFKQISLTSRSPILYFSDRKRPPSGFEKFKRHIKNEKENDSKKATSQNQDQTFEQEKKIEQEPEKSNENPKHEEENLNNKEKKKKEEKNSQKEKEPESPYNNLRYPVIFLAIAYIFWKPIMDHFFEKFFIEYSDFKNFLLQGEINSITVLQYVENKLVKANAELLLKNGKKWLIKIGNIDYFLENLEKFQIETMKKTKEELIPINFDYYYDKIKMFDNAFHLFISMTSMVILFYIYLGIRKTMGSLRGKGGNDIFGMGKSNIKVFGSDSKIKTRFKDVAGLDEPKLEITEFVDFLKKPEKYQALGARIPRGALLSGPPGTGKTMLAKACAGEAEVPFFYMSGSDFVEMFVGLGASRVRDLFKKAKEKSPSIIFIDEIDAVGKKRESKFGGNDERENTLNQLLVEMDGFGTDSQVVVMGATNRKELLDPALTRPGRFDRTIEISLPDIEGRRQIFMVHLTPLKLNPEKTMEEYAKRLATLTPGFSGADIANLCNEAAILAARNDKTMVDSNDFEKATERVIGGLEKNKIISEDERKTVAFHEAGHAVVSWFLEGGAPLLKLTIIPRSKGSLGYAQYLPNESSMETKDELLDRICCLMGGRCSEEFFFKKVTTGASDDLQKIFKIANSLVTKFGMSERVGYVGLLEGDYQKKYADSTQNIIDEEIHKIIEFCQSKTRSTIEKHQNEIKNLATELLSKESLDLRGIINILGDRPFPPKSNFKAYLQTKSSQESESLKTQEKETELKENDLKHQPIE